jgi:hypothetical protein
VAAALTSVVHDGQSASSHRYNDRDGNPRGGLVHNVLLCQSKSPPTGRFLIFDEKVARGMVDGWLINMPAFASRSRHRPRFMLLSHPAGSMAG